MHLLSREGFLNAGATIDEVIETLKIGVIGGGSITYPNTRFTIHALEEYTAGIAQLMKENNVQIQKTSISLTSS